MLVRSASVAIVVGLVASVASAQVTNPTLSKVLGDVTAHYNKQERPMVVFDLDATLKKSGGKWLIDNF